MKRHNPMTTYLGIKIALITLISVVMSSQAARAEEELDLEYTDTIKMMEFSKQLKVRGFKISENVYMGQAKVAGKYGLGFVVDKKTYTWGLNHRGISILKRF